MKGERCVACLCNALAGVIPWCRGHDVCVGMCMCVCVCSCVVVCWSFFSLCIFDLNERTQARALKKSRLRMKRFAGLISTQHFQIMGR